MSHSGRTRLQPHQRGVRAPFLRVLVSACVLLMQGRWPFRQV